jgi:DNA-binding MarR family transcriptional regulator
MTRKTLEADVADFVQSLGLLVHRFRAVDGGDGLSWTETIVLRRLDKQGPTTAATLAREVGVKPQSMGSTVAALEARGLIERKRHVTDGRQFNIALSARGLAVRKSTGDAKRSWLAQAVAKLAEKDQDTLFAAGEILQRLAND